MKLLLSLFYDTKRVTRSTVGKRGTRAGDAQAYPPSFFERKRDGAWRLGDGYLVWKLRRQSSALHRFLSFSSLFAKISAFCRSGEERYLSPHGRFSFAV